MSEKSKIIKGGFFLTIVNAFSHILAIAVNIVLAKLLMPEDFGLVALTMTFIGLVQLFTNMGFGASIIHHSEVSNEQLSSLFWINYIVSIFSWLVIISTAGFASEFYADERLALLIRIASITILLTPIFIVQYKILEKKLEFKTISKINIIGTTVGAASAVFSAFMGAGVFALIVQSIVTTIIRLFLTLSYNWWWPILSFKYNEIRGMIWYSVRFKGGEGALYLERNVDYLLLGKLFTSITLGYYAFAYNIMYTPVKRISYIFTEVLFPSFSSMKDDKDLIVKGYFKSVNLVAVVSFPAMTILAFNAEFIITVVFGERWLDAVPIIQILCFAGAMQSVSQLGDVIFSSIGKPQVGMQISLIRTFLIVVAIIAGAKFGIIWVAYFILIVKIISFIILLITLNRYVDYEVSHVFKSLRTPFLILSSLTFLELTADYIAFLPILKLSVMVLITCLLILLVERQLIVRIFKVLKSKT